jgi:phospholipid transport system substrate-binding protein
MLLTPSVQPASANDDPAVQFVQKVTRELVSANRAGSIVAFSDTLKRNANVPAIGSYALGTHQSKLTPTDRDGYFNGMIRFISRYAATESQKYQVSHVLVPGVSRKASAGVLVDSTVHMRDGSTYEVQWLLHQTGGGYKVRDAKVQVLLGDYWMSPFLKDLFEKYIAENGSVAALVLALNR